jgi:hypothetical protein
MKAKSIKFLAAILGTAIVINTSCYKKTKEQECKSCSAKASETYSNIILGERINEYKNYLDKETRTNFLSTNEEDKANFRKIVNYFNIPFDCTREIIGLSIFVNIKPLSNSTIKQTNVKGSLIYYINGEDLYAETYILKGDKIVKNEFLSDKTSFISPNDIQDVGRSLMADESDKSFFTLINFGKLPVYKHYPSQFQEKISSLNIAPLNKLSGITPGGGGAGDEHYCDITCNSKSAGYCVAREGQTGGESWYCLSGRGCTKYASDKVFPSNPNINTETQNVTLRAFRDNYLSKTTKGMKYINNYYYISDRFLDYVDVNFSILAMSTLVDDIFPLINTLQNQPSSNSVLYNTTRANKITALLNNIKSKLTNTGDKTIIDGIIADVNYYKNKPVSQVTYEFRQ